jgi:uncharacterized protein (TIGR00106 family)
MSSSVLLEFSMFPSDVGESKSEYVSKVIEVVRDSGLPYKLSSMSTVVETGEIREALDLVEKCYLKLRESGTKRVYSVLKFDIREDQSNRLSGKIDSVEKRIGEVNS